MDESLLDRCEALRDLTAAEKRALVALGRRSRSRRATGSSRKDRRRTCFFVIAAGAVEVLKGGQRIAELGAGAILGEMALFNRDLRTSEARCRERCTLLSIPTADFVRLVLQQDPAAVKVMGTLGRLMVQRLQARDAELLKQAGREDPAAARDPRGVRGAAQGAARRTGRCATTRSGCPGSSRIVAAKPVGTAADLAVAYSPGVAEPCLEIARRPGARLRLHDARAPGGRDHQRHRGPGPGQHRRPGLQAGDGREGRPLQALRRPGRVRHRGGRDRPRALRRRRLRARAHLRRHQPRGRPRPGVLRHREGVPGSASTSRSSTTTSTARPSWPERRSSTPSELVDKPLDDDAGRVLGRGRGGFRLREVLPVPGCPPREPGAHRQGRRRLPGPRRRQLPRGAGGGHRRPHPGPGHRGRRRLRGRLRAERPHSGHAPEHEPRPRRASPWPIPCRRSTTGWPSPRAATWSWPPAAATTRTR